MVLHATLALLTTLVAILATCEGVARIATGHRPGRLTDKSRTALILAFVMNAASGLALVTTGHHPHEWLHVMYAVLAFGTVPIADFYVRDVSHARRQAWARTGAGLFTLVLIARLAATG